MNVNAEPPATVRYRGDAYLDACARLLAIVHERDQYPLFWPDDVAAWLSPQDLIAAWVAERNGSVLGHVALHHAGRGSSGLGWPVSFGLQPSQIAWVSRLFVDPAARRRGLASDLLDAASEHATGLGLRPALEVVESDRAAIALYERCGWVRAQSRDWALPDGATVLLHCYVAPVERRQMTTEGESSSAPLLHSPLAECFAPNALQESLQQPSP